MEAAKLVLEYLKVLIWQAIVVFALIKYHEVIRELFYRSKVKLSLFGFEIETKISDLQQSLTSTVGGRLTNQQWELLEKIYKEGAVSVVTECYKMDMQADLSWIRPLRNAGLMMSLPDGEYIEEAEEFKLTPLGKLLMESKMSEKAR
jgi:hypothetical protein